MVRSCTSFELSKKMEEVQHEVYWGASSGKHDDFEDFDRNVYLRTEKLHRELYGFPHQSTERKFPLGSWLFGKSSHCKTQHQEHCKTQSEPFDPLPLGPPPGFDPFIKIGLTVAFGEISTWDWVAQKYTKGLPPVLNAIL